jgi:septal ring factor EnvC (AmiA/AmiB activator)
MIAATEKAIIAMGVVVNHHRQVVKQCEYTNTVVRVKISNAAVIASAQESSHQAMEALKEMSAFADAADKATNTNLKNMQKNLEDFEKGKADEARKIAESVESIKQVITSFKEMKAKSIPMLQKSTEDMEKMIEVIESIRKDQEKQDAIESAI